MRAIAVIFVITLAGALTANLLVNRARGRGWRELRVTMRRDLERGSLDGLLRTRVAGLRLAVATPEDREAAADLAIATARLSAEYGVDCETEAEAAAARAEATDEARPAAVALAARAWLALRRGQLNLASRRASEAMSRDATSARVLHTVGSMRAIAGDLAGAGKAAEAATLVAPDFQDARVAWAEVRLDRGDPTSAANTVRAVVALVPEHTRARLVLAEATRVRGDAPAPEEPAALEAACHRDGAASRTVATACALEIALRRRAEGGPVALTEIVESAPEVTSARVLATSALLAAQLGFVDHAQELAKRAAAAGSESMPVLQWARAAIALGRGHAALVPSLPATSAELHLVGARAAFAASGTAGLASFLMRPVPAAFGAHPEVRTFALLANPSLPVTAEGPLASYVRGLRARLAGDQQAAAGQLAAALDGHGDACRAAGEYIAAVQALAQPLDGKLFEALRVKNGGCVNLPGATAAGAVVPPRAPGRRRSSDRARSLPSPRDPNRDPSSRSARP